MSGVCVSQCEKMKTSALKACTWFFPLIQSGVAIDSELYRVVHCFSPSVRL